MSDAPVQVTVAAFQDKQGADAALDMLKRARKERLIGIEDAAVLSKDENGKLHIKETADMGTGKGAAIGGVLGGAVGAIAGAALAGPAIVGALIGGLATKLRDSGFDNDRLQAVGQRLTPGSSAIVAIVEHKWVQEVRQELAEVGADAVTEAISAELAAQLEAGHDAAWTALATQEGVAVAGRAGSEDEVAGRAALIGRDEAAGVEFVATDEGVAVHGIDVTPGSVTEGFAAAVVEDESVQTEDA